jgi:two-component system, NarL family, sensor histidine kinase UhpB
MIDTTIYRVAQECLSNAVRHGKPSAIAVRIERASDTADRDEITLEIADDGQGMSEPSGAGFGLRGMAERVSAIGGRLTLRNKPGGGLAVIVVLPCQPGRELVRAGLENTRR